MIGICLSFCSINTFKIPFSIFALIGCMSSMVFNIFLSDFDLESKQVWFSSYRLHFSQQKPGEVIYPTMLHFSCSGQLQLLQIICSPTDFFLYIIEVRIRFLLSIILHLLQCVLSESREHI